MYITLVCWHHKKITIIILRMNYNMALVSDPGLAVLGLEVFASKLLPLWLRSCVQKVQVCYEKLNLVDPFESLFKDVKFCVDTQSVFCVLLMQNIT